MSKNAILFAGVVLGVVGAGVVMAWPFRGGTPVVVGDPGTEVRAAQPAAPAPRQASHQSATREITRPRSAKYDVGPDKGLEVSAESGRTTKAGGETEYYVLMVATGIGTFRISADDAASLLRFYEQTSGINKKPEANEINELYVHWSCKPYVMFGFNGFASDGVHFEVQRRHDTAYYLVRKWYANGDILTAKFTAPAFEVVAESLKDLEKLKAVKPVLVLK